ncbi:MAG: deoxyhypusine synthase family protein [Bdellovibrionales bacterium]|nr:deoxyhypusine synthase family protein [Bdellovibrionales bacterium]
MTIRAFVQHHYRHFNAAALRDAADAWVKHLQDGGKMFLTLAGAMSTAELGVSVSELIRKGCIHGISCTGANLEEDVFNLLAHEHYERIPHFRNLDPHFEQSLCDRGMNRVTDTCIPEDEAIRKIEHRILERWQAADGSGERYFPHEFFFQMLRSKELEGEYQIPAQDSWMLAASEANLPIFVPGWEDSTLGNIFVSHVLEGRLKNYTTMKGGVEYMGALVKWYEEATKNSSMGFFQIGGGIAGDFPICVVPLIRQDLQRDCPTWGYFCQVSDSTTSYGSYSGAIPSEKISWGKIEPTTPSFVIESDASIVAPIIFQYVLESMES